MINTNVQDDDISINVQKPKYSLSLTDLGHRLRFPVVEKL